MNSSASRGPSAAAEFFSYAVPAIISMVLTASIVVVDGLFIGRSVGSAGLAAVNLTLPVFYLFLGTGIMITAGGSILATHKRGAGDSGEAGSIFSDTLAVLVLTTGALLVLLVLFFEPVLSFLRAGDALSGYTRSYLGTIRWFYPFMMLNLGFSGFIRAEGKPALSMVFGLLGNLFNVVLDYLFIFRFGWELRGAALASGISVFIPMILCTGYILSGKSYYRFQRPRFRKETVRGMFCNGSSEMIGQLSVSLSTWLFNWIILQRLGVDGLAAFTIAGYLIFIQGMILTGLATGLGPVVGYHWGAGNRERILQVLKIALTSGFAVGILAWGIVALAGEHLAFGISGGDEAIRRMARSGYWIFTSAFLFNGFNLLTSSFFTSLGEAGPSALISSLRGLVLNCVCILVLPVLLGSRGIWLSFPAAEILTFLVAAGLLVWRLKGFTNREGRDGKQPVQAGKAS